MILVIGATGKVGGGVVRELLARKVPLRAMVRDPRRGADLRERGVPVIVGNMALPETLDAAFEGVRRVFVASSPDPSQVEMERHLLGAAQRQRVEQCVRMSVLGARPDAPVSLLRWHARSEEQFAASGMPHANLRCASFMQNFLGDAPTVREEGRLYGSIGDARVAYVDVGDIAAVAVGVLTTPIGTGARTLEVTGPASLTMQQVVETISRVTGHRVASVHLSRHEARDRFVRGGFPEWLADDLVALGDEFAGGSNATVTDVVRTVGGREPRTFEAFVREHAAEFQPAA